MVDSVAAEKSQLADARKARWPHKNEVHVRGSANYKANMGGKKKK